MDRLSHSLARHGHEVHVIHCRDAFEISRGRQTPRAYQPDPKVRLHPLEKPPLTPLPRSRRTRPAAFYQDLRAIRRLIDIIQPDVLHFHNLSLIGGPSLLKIDAAAGGQADDGARTLARLPAQRALEAR